MRVRRSGVFKGFIAQKYAKVILLYILCSLGLTILLHIVICNHNSHVDETSFAVSNDSLR